MLLVRIGKQGTVIKCSKTNEMGEWLRYPPTAVAGSFEGHLEVMKEAANKGK